MLHKKPEVLILNKYSNLFGNTQSYKHFYDKISRAVVRKKIMQK